MAEPTSTSDYIDLDTAAAELGMEPSDLYVVIREGNLPAAWSPSRKVYAVKRVDVEAYRETRTT